MKDGCKSSRLSLFYMGVIGNMVFAVAEIAVAARAVPKFQVGVGNICPPTYCTAVVICRLRPGCVLLGADGNRSGGLDLAVRGASSARNKGE